MPRWARAAVCLAALYWASYATNTVSGLTRVETGKLDGRVENEAGEPVGNARVWLLELGRSTTTPADGSFAFSDVAPGVYQLLVETELEAAATGSIGPAWASRGRAHQSKRNPPGSFRLSKR